MRPPAVASLSLLLLTALAGCGDDERPSDDDVAAIRRAEQLFDRTPSVRVETEIGALDDGSYTPRSCVTQRVDQGRPGGEDDKAQIERRSEGGCGGPQRATVVVDGERIWASRTDGRWRAGRLRSGLGESLTPRRRGFADLVAEGNVFGDERRDGERTLTVDVPAKRLRAVAGRLGTTLPAGGGDVETELEVTLDRAGRLSRVELDVLGDGLGARTTTTYEDYGDVDLIVGPDADDVVGSTARVGSEAQLETFARSAGPSDQEPGSLNVTP